jgi:filamentous hemagglutinin family protein
MKSAKIRKSVAAGAMGYLCVLVLVSGQLMAGPQGAQVVSGSASVAQNGSRTTITAGNNAIINYRGFSIAPGETVQFIQPGASSRVLNRVTGPDPSVFAGTLLANGQVYFVNPAGVFFTKGAVVNVGALYAAAGSLSNQNFLTGVNHFTDLHGAVVNEGSLSAQAVHLIGERVANYGSIVSPGGVVTLLAGNDVYMAEDGRGVYVKIEGAKSNAGGAGPAVENAGNIQAEGGKVMLGAGDVYSLAIRNTGTIKAKDVKIEGQGAGIVEVSGTIDASGKGAGQTGGTVTVTGEKVALTGAMIDASGDAGGGTVLIGGDTHGGNPDVRNATYTWVGPQAAINADALTSGNGGKVVLWSDQTTQYFGAISVRGGAQAGNGGFVEVSGANSLNFQGKVEAGAPNGTAGTLLLDPLNLFIIDEPPGIGDQDFNVFPAGTIPFAGPDTPNNTVSVGILQVLGDVNILLQAQHTLTVGDSIGNPAFVFLPGLSTHTLTLQAGDAATVGGGNVIFNTGSAITTGGGGVTIIAGNNAQGTGAATLGAITTNGGAINVTAQRGLIVHGDLNAGAGTILLQANNNGSLDGLFNFTQDSGTLIQSSNNTAGAITITVNSGNISIGGGALVSNITASGAAGGLTIDTTNGGVADGGSILQTLGGTLAAGTGGIALITGPGNIGAGTGTSAINLASSLTAPVTATTNGGNVWLNGVGNLLLGVIDTHGGNLDVRTFGAGGLNAAGTITTGGGSVTIFAGDNSGSGPGTGAATLSAINTSGGAISVLAQQGLTVTGNINSETGTILLQANDNASLDGVNNFVQSNGTLIQSSNNTAGAITITVNSGNISAGGGAQVSNITASGAAGGLTIDTTNGGVADGGSITRTAVSTLTAGTGGIALITGPGNIGTGTGSNAINLASSLTTPVSIETNGGNVWLNGVGNLLLGVIDTHGGNLDVRTFGAGGLNASATITTGGGSVTMFAGDNSGSGPGTGAAVLSVINTSGGSISVLAQQGLSATGNINSGSGTILLQANDNASLDGINNFVQSNGTLIQSSNNTAGAITITVNSGNISAGGGAQVSNITASGAAGGLTIDTTNGGVADGGSITRTAVSTLTAGTGGIALITGPGNIGTGTGSNAINLANSLTTPVSVETNSGNVWLNGVGNLLLGVIDTHGGNLDVRTFGAGALNASATITTGGGSVTLFAGDNTGSGPGTGAATLSVINTSGGSISVLAQQGLTVTGNINSGTGTILLQANDNASLDGVNNFIQTNGTLIQSSNNTAGAITITVNSGNISIGGGAQVSNITASRAGGGITVDTTNGGVADGGAITRTASNLLTAGTGGVTLITGPGDIGTAISPINVASSSTTPVSAITNGGNVWLNGLGNLLLGPIDTHGATANVHTAGTGTITVPTGFIDPSGQTLNLDTTGTVSLPVGGFTNNGALVITTHGTGSLDIAGPVTGSGTFTVLGSGHTTTLGANLTQAAITIDDAIVVVPGTWSLTSTSGGIAINGDGTTRSLSASGAGANLTLQTNTTPSQPVSLQGTFDTGGGASLNNLAIQSGGAAVGPVTLTASGTLLGTLIVSSGTGLSLSTAGGTLTADQGIAFAPAVTLTGGSDSTLATDGGLTHDITFSSTTDATTGEGLTLNAGNSGNVLLSLAAGGATPLGALTVTNAHSISLNDVTTTGDQSYAVSGIDATSKISLNGNYTTTSGGNFFLNTNRTAPPVDATIYKDGGDLDITCNSFMMWTNDKLTVVGNLDLTATVQANLGDLTTLGNMNVTAATIILLSRSQGAVLTSTGSLVMDSGVDYVAGGTITFSSAPTGTGAGVRPNEFAAVTSGSSVPGQVVGVYPGVVSTATLHFGPDVLDLAVAGTPLFTGAGVAPALAWGSQQWQEWQQWLLLQPGGWPLSLWPAMNACPSGPGIWSTCWVPGGGQRTGIGVAAFDDVAAQTMQGAAPQH